MTKLFSKSRKWWKYCPGVPTTQSGLALATRVRGPSSSKHMRCYSVSNVAVPRMEGKISGTDGVKKSKQPQKLDRMAKAIARNNQNCSTTTLVGKWEGANPPPPPFLSSPGKLLLALFALFPPTVFLFSYSFIFLRPHIEISLLFY